MTNSTIKIFIRRAGFWNSKDFKISSQFGHIFLYIDNLFYSFTQKKFLPEDNKNSFQIIDKNEFYKTYKNQNWYVITLELTQKEIMKILSYFKNSLNDSGYSIVNNCMRQCQLALENAGFQFPRYFIFPGSMLSFLKKKKNNLPVLKIEKLKIEK
jgi:hypothetical protein